ncbi:uncharacterized protein LOC129576887 isoform X2 [Sitodiplosis mosellana]|uniref:uncharacterized protein LOC129576887 isoform X2 n=1 Tax=Sitodiplosis mosellana TaxID=263140 RepID=UPI0024440177|nr:uncharacterized protein LOC129576887 isoform X2 [Sitodiplosis mosellana]
MCSVRSNKLTMQRCLKRRQFADWTLDQLKADPDFGSKIIFSDEAHCVNKQNCRIWDAENPRHIQEVEMKPLKCTVWCAFWPRGVIGPYFFENEDGQRVNVNAERYQHMIREYFWPRLRRVRTSGLLFQQDGASSHTSPPTIQVLNEKFDKRVISKNGKVYANNPSTIEDLKANIRHEITSVPVEMCQNVIKNWADRMVSLKPSRGGHLDDIIFHY